MTTGTLEAELLLATLRAGLGTAPAAAVVAAAAEPGISWDDFFELTIWHRVPGLALSGLRGASAVDRVPAAVVGRLEAAYFETLARNVRARAELARVGSHLAGSGIDVVLLKGAALIETVYADPGLRTMLDIDLLVREDAMSRAAAIVADLGYRPAPPFAAATTRHWLLHEHRRWPPLVAPDGSLVVELHHRLGGATTPLGFDVAGVWGRARTVEHLPGRVPAPEDLLLHVALHWLLDRRLRSEGSLGQLGDVARLLTGAAGTIRPDALAATARQHGVAGQLTTALTVARDLFALPMSSEEPGALVAGASNAALTAELVRRRVFRARRWVTLERLGPRTTTLRQLLPPHPRRVREGIGLGRPWRDRVVPYASWAAGAADVVLRMRDVRAEVAFGRSYESLVAVHPPPR